MKKVDLTFTKALKDIPQDYLNIMKENGVDMEAFLKIYLKSTGKAKKNVKMAKKSIRKTKKA